MATKKTKTILRKAEIAKDKVIEQYIEGQLKVSEIALKHSTSTENIELIVKRHWEGLTNMRESRSLMAGEPGKVALNKLQNTDLINTKFIDMLSPDASQLLSEAEATYAWVYVHTGDIVNACEVSKLSTGLHRDKERPTRLSYDKSLLLRGQFLNEKPNVKVYITQLREQRLIDMDIGKAKIQSELVEQLEQLKATGDPRARRDIIKLIELLGKTIGAFIDKVEIHEVNPSEALDQLIELATQAQVEEL